MRSGSRGPVGVRYMGDLRALPHRLEDEDLHEQVGVLMRGAHERDHLAARQLLDLRRHVLAEGLLDGAPVRPHIFRVAALVEGPLRLGVAAAQDDDEQVRARPVRLALRRSLAGVPGQELDDPTGDAREELAALAPGCGSVLTARHRKRHRYPLLRYRMVYPSARPWTRRLASRPAGRCIRPPSVSVPTSGTRWRRRRVRSA